MTSTHCLVEKKKNMNEKKKGGREREREEKGRENFLLCLSHCIFLESRAQEFYTNIRQIICTLIRAIFRFLNHAWDWGKVRTFLSEFLA